MTECDEVAIAMAEVCEQRFATFDQALAYVRAQMPDETTTIQCNVAETLLALRGNQR
jgi:hypothetical protein